jgi:hypothetical protein
VGAQINPLGHVYAAPHGVGLQRPLAVSHELPGSHEVLVQRGMHVVPTPPTPELHGPVEATQTLSGVQPASAVHWLNPVNMPPPPQG